MSSFQYIDIHSHLNFKDYDMDREAVIEKMRTEGVATITVGTGIQASQEGLALADKYPHLFACIGVHPTHEEVFDEKAFEELVKNPKVVAVGECGLDYKETKNEIVDKKRQKDIFEQHIDFAVKYDKPLMIHCRQAYPDCLDILKSKQKEYGEKVRGNFHFFTEPVETAKKVLDTGFSVSFTGPITFVPAYEEIVKFVPIDCMHAETDAPFASPVPYRGKRNNPLYVKEVVAKIAQIKNIPLEDVVEALLVNADKLFGIKP